MSDTRAEPCTVMPCPGRSKYVDLLRHWSFALTAEFGRPGRSGMTICGVRSAVDQALMDHRAANGRPRVDIGALPDCTRCMTFVRRVGA